MPRASAVDSKERILAAAAREFAAHGYAGANVDRIARAARLNKAMIYYHFAGKAALYHDILNDMFAAVQRRVAAVAASADPPDAKIRRYVEAIAGEAEARPHFPPIWLRELAEGGRHIDQATRRHVRGVLAALQAILDDGARAGAFRRVNLLMLHGGIIAPLMFFFATARVRGRLLRGLPLAGADLSTAAVVAHIQQLALAQLEGKVS
jgi:TetR/AcrR family transcriptional regulator